MSDERRQEDVPMDRLTRLADAAVTALERAPEYVEATDKAVILVDDDEGGGLVRHGYEDERVKRGEFDASKAEADEWAATPEGQAAMQAMGASAHAPETGLVDENHSLPSGTSSAR